MSKITQLRKEFTLNILNEKDLDSNPIEQFKKWLKMALDQDIVDSNAMVLSTATKAGKPSARVVLLREVQENGFIFYTNYESKKGKQLAENPFASLTFYWKELEKQVRIEGKIEKTSEQESDAYFNLRPKGSRIGAIASRQSQVIKNRKHLEEKVEIFEDKYKLIQDIPRPKNWGGYCLKPILIEFWQGRANRLHDRIQFKKVKNVWIIERLSP